MQHTEVRIQNIFTAEDAKNAENKYNIKKGTALWIKQNSSLFVFIVFFALFASSAVIMETVSSL